MLCYIDIEHEVVLDDPMRREKHLTMRMGEKLRFEELSGLPCLLLRYRFVSNGWIDRVKPAAVLISGSFVPWTHDRVLWRTSSDCPRLRCAYGAHPRTRPR